MENLDLFLDGLDSLTVTFQTSHARNVKAFFDNAFLDKSIGETALDSTQPRLTCKSSDLMGVARETLVLVSGKTYSVMQIQPDGTGFSTVLLAHE